MRLSGGSRRVRRRFAPVSEDYIKYLRIDMCGTQCRSRLVCQNGDSKWKTTQFQTGAIKEKVSQSATDKTKFSWK